MRQKFLRVLLSGGAALAFTQAQAQALPPTSFPANTSPTASVFYGNTYGEWSARWVQWLFSIPSSSNPQLDNTGASCGQKQSGPVWFLAGLFFPGSVTRACTIPAGKALFFPIVSATFGAAAGDCKPTVPNVECNIADLRMLAAAAMDPVTLTTSVDGKPLRNLGDQRVQSPVSIITFPADAIFGNTAGTYAPNVSDGYWLMLPPLSAGAHTIEFKGVIAQPSAFAGTYQVKYNLTVSP